MLLGCMLPSHWARRACVAEVLDHLAQLARFNDVFSGGFSDFRVRQAVDNRQPGHGSIHLVAWMCAVHTARPAHLHFIHESFMHLTELSP